MAPPPRARRRVGTGSPSFRRPGKPAPNRASFRKPPPAKLLTGPAPRAPSRRLTMFKQIGPLEITLILVVLLLLFGAKRLPEIGKSVGKSLREFKSATKGLGDDVKSGLGADDED